jgi:hypothetical protein
MTMYVEVHHRSLEKSDEAVADDSLLNHVLSLRAALPLRDLGAGVWSGEALAAEVAYDRALINLAARHGIDVAPVHFAHPRIERKRLEFELSCLGVSLHAQAEESTKEKASTGRDS